MDGGAANGGIGNEPGLGSARLSIIAVISAAPLFAARRPLGD